MVPLSTRRGMCSRSSRPMKGWVPCNASWPGTTSRNSSVVTSEPRSLVSPSHQIRIDEETNEGSWSEIAALFRRETNITSNYLMAMAFAGMVAAAGLWTDTVHIVVGAMVIAPGFEPILRVPFGLLASDSRSSSVGLRSTLIGYAAMMAGAAAAYLLLRVVQPSSAELSAQPWVQYWSSLKPSSIIIVTAASAAGAAIIAAQRSVLTAGVMIALALVPSASIVGMGMAAGDFALAGKALMRWGADAGCVALAGGLVFLLKRRVLHAKGSSARAAPPQ